jgi:hypothetical protein
LIFPNPASSSAYVANIGDQFAPWENPLFNHIGKLSLDFPIFSISISG